MRLYFNKAGGKKKKKTGNKPNYLQWANRKQTRDDSYNGAPFGNKKKRNCWCLQWLRWVNRALCWVKESYTLYHSIFFLIPTLPAYDSIFILFSEWKYYWWRTKQRLPSVTVGRKMWPLRGNTREVLCVESYWYLSIYMCLHMWYNLVEQGGRGNSGVGD